MHIAFWSPAWPLQRFQNGIITYVHAMKIGLERLGHRVSVFTPILPESEADDHVHLVNTGKSTLWSKAARRLFPSRDFFESGNREFARGIASEILRVHARDPIDLIEMEESFGWFAEVQDITALPLVVKLHGPAFLSYVDIELGLPLAQKRIALEGRALSRAQTVIAPCQITLSQTIKKYALSPPLARHVVNPLVVDNHNAPLWTLDVCDRGTILFVGRFDLRKGGDIILRAFLLLLKQKPRLKLIFVGPDLGIPLPDGSNVRFHAYCDKLFPAELREAIDYRGALSNQELAHLRVKALVTIVASRWENPGYTLLEALAQGCPVVSSDAGGCPEVVGDWITGRLARSEEPADFASKIQSLLDDPERAAKLGRAGRESVLERYALEKVVRQSIEIYDTASKMRNR
jgi:glycosyltransferase involved in cell wall biosynthesis